MFRTAIDLDAPPERLVQFCKLGEQAERYDDMAACIRVFCEKVKELGNEERNLLSVAYKNVVGARRSAWRIISSFESKITNNATKQKVTEEYRQKIERELVQICDEVLVCYIQLVYIL